MKENIQKQIEKSEMGKEKGYLVITAGMFEKVLDGVALGVAFSSTPDTALSTFIAVWAHELPSQMGALGLLLNAGFTTKEAICWNIILNCSAFFGVAFGLAVG